jgi:hypothetical protein
MSKTESESTTPKTTSTGSSKNYRLLAVAAALYSAWLIWLLYVGLVNFRSGNQ